MATKGKMPATLRKYQTLVKRKSAFCAGKLTKGLVKTAAADYVKSAVAHGQTKEDATKKANRVLTTACKMTANISGKKRRASTTGRKTTTAKRRPAGLSKMRGRPRATA